MPVDTQHPDYSATAEKWQTCADAVRGQWAVHAAGERYLPKLKEQTDDEYKAYKTRTPYFNATGRTLDGLVGMVYRKAPIIEAPDAVLPLVNDIDLQDTSAQGLSEQIMRQVMIKNRVGVLVEYPQVQDQPQSAATAAQMNLRPYASKYEAESIINWKVERVNNAMQPTLIVLTESFNASEDEYKQDWKQQLRVLKLAEFGYIQQVWRKGDKDWYQEGDDIVPLMNGNPLPFIPFYMFGAEDTTFAIHEPPILDLADLNLSHYRVSADLEHGCHFTGLPMLFLAGVSLKENEKIYLGSQTAVVTDNENADGKFIEFSGQGLGALEKNLDRKEKQMAAIGARMLEQQKNGVESEGAMALRSNGETSVLAGVANLVSGQFTKMLAFMSQWAGVNGEIKFQLNTDYLPAGMTSQQLAELVKSWQAGAISQQTLFENLKRGEIIADDVTLEDEQERIGTATPSLAE